jgi:Tfp pilus assembly protein FimT
MAMIDMIFLELAIAFVIVATLAAVATTSGSQTVRGVANKTVNGSLTAALVSAALTAWLIFWPPM